MSPPCFHPGGQGANVARALVTLGQRPELVALNGGETGVILRALLDAYGIRHRLVETQSSTKAVLALVAPDGARIVFESPLPHISRHESDDLFSVASTLALESQVLVLSGTLAPGTHPDFFIRLVQLANEHHIPTVVDIAPELLKSVLPARPTLVKPNLSQLGTLVGRELHDSEMEEVVQAMLAVRQLGASIVVTSMGNSGAIASFDNSVIRATPPALEAIEESGAGDGMVAGLAAGLARGYTMERTLVLSTAAGSASVLRRGMGSFKSSIVRKLAQWVRIDHLT